DGPGSAGDVYLFADNRASADGSFETRQSGAQPRPIGRDNGELLRSVVSSSQSVLTINESIKRDCSRCRRRRPFFVLRTAKRSTEQRAAIAVATWGTNTKSRYVFDRS